MTIEEVLRMPDSEIIKSGTAIKIITRAYRDLTGEQPCYCDTQLRNFIRVVRLKMKNHG